jgi:glycosyltransferase involved in cell wall biosynthesis
LSQRKRILVFTDWFLPGFKAGGPIRSLTNMTAHLGGEFDFRFVTSDRDLFSDVPYDGITPGKWIRLEDGTQVIYLSPEMQNAAQMKSIIMQQQADVLYLNSMFSRNFTFLPLQVRNRFLPKRKVILAPRGMLGEGALRIKPLKKKLFLVYAKLTRLYRNIRWHASSEIEAAEIRKVMGRRSNVHVAMNLSPRYHFDHIHRVKKQGELRLVFISRISKKKNLDGALRLLSKLQPGEKVYFDIYGPAEDELYKKECDAIIAALPSNIRVQYRGPIANEQVVSTLADYHVSILLTFNENFGHSIVESMAAGCPVLISGHTPWRNLSAVKAGWDVSLDDEHAQLQAIRQAIAMNQEEFNTWSRHAQHYARSVSENKELLDQNRKLFA